MNQIMKILQDAVYHSAGIVPIETTHHDFNRMLASLPEEEARMMKRKFRKLWRKFAKAPKKGTPSHYVSQSMGLGKTEPTRANMNTRKREVHRRIMLDVVLPMRNKIMNGEEK